MYTPAFVEIFLGWCAVVAWASWLRPRTSPGPATVAVAAMPWATGFAVLAGQLAALLGLMQQSPASASPDSEWIVRVGSLGSSGVILIALVTEAGLTILWFVRRQQKG